MLEDVLGRKSRVHFVGIGGIGMSALASLLVELGHQVSGSDLRMFSEARELRGRGAVIAVCGHGLHNLQRPDLVVVSSAVPADNVEVVEARRRQVSVVPRGDLLAALMASRRGIAVAGSHGKTTTTAMIATMLLDAGKDPTCIVGGLVPQLGGNARLGRGEFLVAEADESDRSFLRLRPEIGIITNIDLEHITAYRDEEDLVSAFRDFANSLPDTARCVVCADDARVRRVIGGIRSAPFTYGFQEGAGLTGELQRLFFGGSVFRVRRGRTVWGDVTLQVSGAHNVLNALSAVGTSLLLGLPTQGTIESLARFRGVARRLERKGSARGVAFYDDYGHHPAEVRATLEAARSSGRRLVVLFQPHRFSRTRDLMAEFATCFEAANELFVTDIYAAGETPVPGVSAVCLTEEIRRAGHRAARYVARAEVVESVCRCLQPGDLVLTLGAGDVDRLGEEILQEWSAEHGHKS